MWEVWLGACRTLAFQASQPQRTPLTTHVSVYVFVSEQRITTKPRFGTERHHLRYAYYIP